jgi:hypothetical protein
MTNSSEANRLQDLATHKAFQKMKIVTTFVDPPIPTGFEWVANYVGDEPCDDGSMASGCGPSEEAAIANLIATHPRRAV